MYVCMYIYIYIPIYIYIYVHVETYIWHMFTFDKLIFIYTNTMLGYTYITYLTFVTYMACIICMCIYIYTHNMCNIFAHIYIYVYIYIHMYVYICVKYIHVCTVVCCKSNLPLPLSGLLRGAEWVQQGDNKLRGHGESRRAGIALRNPWRGMWRALWLDSNI